MRGELPFFSVLSLFFNCATRLPSFVLSCHDSQARLQSTFPSLPLIHLESSSSILQPYPHTLNPSQSVTTQPPTAKASQANNKKWQPSHPSKRPKPRPPLLLLNTQRTPLPRQRRRWYVSSPLLRSWGQAPTPPSSALSPPLTHANTSPPLRQHRHRP